MHGLLAEIATLVTWNMGQTQLGTKVKNQELVKLALIELKV
jgi:hypothetical protein